MHGTSVKPPSDFSTYACAVKTQQGDVAVRANAKAGVCVLDVRIAAILCIGSARVFGVGVAGIIPPLPHGSGKRRRSGELCTGQVLNHHQNS